MRRGFLLSAPDALNIAPRVLPDAPLLRTKNAGRDDLTRVVSSHPHIVCSDTRLSQEGAPHFMYLPPGRTDMVFVDYLESLQDMARWPVWSRAPPIPPHPPLYEQRDVPGKGRGMVARRAIKAGELIVSERPVYAQRAELMRSADFDQFNGLSYAAPVAGLSSAAQASIYGLSSAFGSKRHALAGIFHTNNLELDITDEPDPANRFVGCFPAIARANHDCSPSANYYFVFGTFCGELRAVRDLRAGEEITISYCDVLAPRAERQATLERLFCFRCACASCALVGTKARQSDERRAALGALLARIENPDGTTPLERLRAGLQYAQQEALAARYAQVLFYGSACLMCRMDFANGLEWARMAKAAYLDIEGPDSATLRAMLCFLPDL